MTRTRAKGSFATSSYQYGSTNSDGVRDFPYYQTYPDGSGQTVGTTDESDGLFYRNQREGKLTIRPYQSLTLSRSNGSGSFLARSTENGNISHFGSGDVLYSRIGSRIQPVFLESQSATASAVNSANAAVTPVSALTAVTLAELGKTREMILKAGKSALQARSAILAYADELRRMKRLSQARSLAESASSFWLQARLGWVPLYYDIKGHIQAFNRQKHPWYQGRGSGSDSNTVSSGVKQATYWAFNGPCGIQYEDVHTQKLTVRAGIYYTDELDPHRRTAQSLGIDAGSIPLVLWDLTRASWLFDYFVDVSTWLQAVAPKTGVRVLGSWTSFKMEDTAQRSLIGVVNPPSGVVSASSSPETLYAVKRTRSLGANPTPLPSWAGGPSSSIQALNTAAYSFLQLSALFKKVR